MIKILLLLLFSWQLSFAQKSTSSQNEAQLLRLSLDVMLYNKDLPNALHIAQTGAKRYKEDLFWQEKAAQIALWMGKTDLALQYYSTLFRTTKNQKYKNAIEELLANGSDNPLLIDLLEQSLNREYNLHDIETLYKYYYEQGYLERGYRFFSDLSKRYDIKTVHQKALSLAFTYQKPKQLKKAYLKFERRFGLDKSLLYEYATLLFSERAFEKLFATLERWHDHFNKDDRKLYKLLAESAYITQHEKALLQILETMHSYEMLSPFQQTQYLTLLQKHAPHRALQILLEKFQKSPDKALFYQSAYLALQIQSYNTLNILWQKLPEPLLHELEKESQYRSLCAQKNRYIDKKPAKVLQCYQKALTLTPVDASLHESYLWYLLEINNQQKLQKEIALLEKRPSLAQKLPYPLTLGYLNLQQGKKVIRYLQALLLQEPENWRYQLLTAQAEALAYDESYAAKRYFYAKLFAQKNIADIMKKEDAVYDFISLLIQQNPKTALVFLEKMKNNLSQKSYRQLYDSYLFQTGAYEKLQQSPVQTPALRYALARRQNDRTEVAALLKENILSPWDRMDAYAFMNEKKRYTNTLFQALQDNPNNPVLQQSYTAHILQKPTYATSLKYIKRGKLISKETELSYSKHLSQKYTLSIEAKYAHYDQYQKQQDRKQLSVALTKALKRGSLEIVAGMGEDSKRYTYLKSTLRISKKRHTIQLETVLHEEDESTNRTLLYGYQHRVTLQEHYQLNKYENIALKVDLTKHKIKQQTIHAAATTLSYSRYLKLAYPDLYTNLYASVQHYGNDPKHLLPESFWQTGIDLGIGIQSKQHYYTQWHPYAQSTLLYNNRTNFGYALTLGAGKRLTRKDRFNIELLYANGTEKYQEDYFSLVGRYEGW